MRTLNLKGVAFLAASMILLSCNQAPKKSAETAAEAESQSEVKLSLAQWSLHKAIRSGEMSPYDFARQASELGFSGLEYVNQLYNDVFTAEDKSAAVAEFVAKNNVLAAEYGLTNVLIMIDGEGALSTSDADARAEAIENHKLWIDAASEMGCSAVRLNLYGEKDPELWKANSIASLSALSAYAAPKGINVLVENHGRISSNAAALMEVINGVDAENCGTLPDFGNFCIAEEGYGSVFDGSCTEVYDIYQGVSEMMPKAMALSAKSNDFDENGNETFIDYTRMLQIAKENGYDGFIGVEYEGSRLSEIEGIKATRDLLIKASAAL